MTEPHRLRGPTDRVALDAIRRIIETTEPMATVEFDDEINPRELRITFHDGIGDASTSLIDADWHVTGDYKFHHTDDRSIDFRWGKHPHGGEYVHVTGLEHFHPPPDATSDPHEVEQSCISVGREVLVCRAVLTLWRAAFDANDLSRLNSASNPP